MLNLRDVETLTIVIDFTNVRGYNNRAARHETLWRPTASK